MARPPPPDPDWLEALRRPVAGPVAGAQGASSSRTQACARCHRPAKSLESWLERRRLRVHHAGAPGGFRYVHNIREHLVCGPCYMEVRGGRPVTRTHAFKVIALVVAGAALMAASLPAFLPNLTAAFWRNGAAPDGWHEHHVQRRPVFLQGRD